MKRTIESVTLMSNDFSDECIDTADKSNDIDKCGKDNNNDDDDDDDCDLNNIDDRDHADNNIGNNNNDSNKNNPQLHTASGITMGVRLPESKRNCILIPPPAKTSVWWKEFMQYPSSLAKVVELKNVYVCKVCYANHKSSMEVPESKWEVRLSKDLSPTPLKKHLFYSHRGLHDKLIAEQMVKTAEEEAKESASMNLFVSSSTQTLFLEKLVDLVTEDSLPISLVESKNLKDLFAVVTKRELIPSREKMVDLINSRAIADRIALKKYFVSMGEDLHICITSDNWTSKANETYMVFAACWHDKEWRRHYLTLDCLLFEGNTKAEDIVEMVLKILSLYEIHSSRVVLMVQDNEPSNNAAGRSMPFPWSGCVDHLLDLVVGTVFSHPSVKDDLAFCRSIITSITGSSQLAGHLEEIQTKMAPTEPPLKIVQDVVTRWSSTFKMVSRLCKLKPYLIALHSFKHLDRKLSEDQWRLIEMLVVLLEPFARIQTFLEGSSYVTCSWVPYVVFQLRTNLSQVMTRLRDNENNDPLYTKLLPVAADMLEKFNSKFGKGDNGINQTIGPRQVRVGITKAYYLGAITDPRTKELRFMFEGDRKEVINLLESEIIQILKLRKEPRIAREESRPERRASASTFAPLNCFVEMESYFVTDNSPDVTGAIDTLADQRIEDQARMAVAAWMHIPAIPMSEDPVKFWTTHHTTMPLVSAVARKYLCCMATSAECERAASSAGRVVEDYRSRLHPENVRNLVFLHDSHQKIKSLALQ